MQQILELLGISDLSGVPPDLQFMVCSLLVLYILAESFHLLRIVLYRIFGGDK